MSRSASKLSTCRPNALRLTPMSMSFSGSGLWSASRLARTIMPAQVPQMGNPPLTRSETGFRRS